jgi:hypothetical protein
MSKSPVSTYINADGHLVQVYAAKKQKPSTWMRGEVFCGITQRIDVETGGMIAKFSRKNGKY